MLSLLFAPAFALPDLSPGVAAEPPSVHAAHARQFAPAAARRPAPALPGPAQLPVATPGPDMMVYGYLAYWDDDLATVPWDELTHIAIFNAEAEPDGSLSSTDRWDDAADAVAIAGSYGVDVHLCVTNFDTTELDQLLNDPVARTTLVNNLAAHQASTGAQGINIDFELMPSSARAGMVAFIEELEAAVGDVVIATPSVDWSDAFDYAALTDHADLFIMGYGYHWSGSSTAGPTDPLFAGSGTVWSGLNSYSLSWSLDDYLAEGADPARVILGLPLYGRAYAASSSTIPSSSLGDGGAVVFADAWATAATHGSTYEPDSYSRMAWTGSEQVWFGDAETVADRIAYARDDAGVGGVGFWALNYEGTAPDFWEAVREQTTWSTGTVPVDSAADTAVDTGTGVGPTDTGTAPEPADPDDPVVDTGSGSDDEADFTRPAVQPPPPEEKGGCGCASAGPLGGLGGVLWVSVLAVVRRRRPGRAVTER